MVGDAVVDGVMVRDGVLESVAVMVRVTVELGEVEGILVGLLMLTLCPVAVSILCRVSGMLVLIFALLLCQLCVVLVACRC